jgi:hypothetical protein
MSEEQNLPLEFKEMADAYAEPKEERETFSSDLQGIEKAADALEESRAAEKEITERKYIEVGGERHGQDVPPDHAIDISRATRDLARQRGFEAEFVEQQGAEALRDEVDSFRAAEHAKQQQQQQPQQAQDVQPQAQTSPEQVVPPGVDAEVVDALQKSPKLRAAVEQELGKAEHARRQYAEATHVAARAAVESILADWPELVGLNGEQIGAVVQAMSISNPERHQQLTAKLQRAETIHRMSEQAKSVQAEIMRQQLAHWSQQQDRQMDQHLANESPEIVKGVKENIGRIARDVYGLDPQQLGVVFANNPILRSAEFQRVFFDAAKFHLMQSQLTDKKYRDAPPVMRPGTSDNRPSADDARVVKARAEFLRDSNPRSAAAYLLARRAAK